ncbi:MAG: hypothetical protein L0Z50_15170 [Verrucomicrobiales bacterium]|nr:hypothetical protein [Verrucomicrobiales bacterium]
MRPYEELVQFIASLSPREVIDFKPSETARQRVWDLIERQKASPLPADEKSELDHCLEIEHLMRLGKARALGEATVKLLQLNHDSRLRERDNLAQAHAVHLIVLM